MLIEPIPDRRMADCLAVLMSPGEPTLAPGDITRITRQTGGLFNFLLRVETSVGTFFFKQYLDGVPNATYALPNVPAKDRALLAYNVQELATNAAGQATGSVPRITKFDRERSAFLMPEGNGTDPLINHLCKGQIPDAVMEKLPKVLASLHQSTYETFSEDSIYGNRTFRDFKLQLQYDGIAERLNSSEAEIVLACKEEYRTKRECVTHGDINSRNVLVKGDAITVIDFEQSHLGAPAYDLAYILSEFLISALHFGWSNKLGMTIQRFLDRYFEYFPAVDRTSVETEITRHIAVQAIYRFWGPSRASWTFYVDEQSKSAIVGDCRSLLRESRPIGKLL